MSSARARAAKKSSRIEESKKQAVFFSSDVFQSAGMFQHSLRIPDVMICVNKARFILNHKGLKAPLWMWGLVEKGETFTSPADMRLMSFCLSVGLYERLLRRSPARPDFLIGSSPALGVCARVRTFERAVMDIMSGKPLKDTSARVYKRRSPDSIYFSLQYLSKNPRVLKDLKKRHRIAHCVSVLPLSKKEQKQISSAGAGLEFVWDKDLLLSWLNPVFKRYQMKPLPYAAFC